MNNSLAVKQIERCESDLVIIQQRLEEAQTYSEKDFYRDLIIDILYKQVNLKMIHSRK